MSLFSIIRKPRTRIVDPPTSDDSAKGTTCRRGAREDVLSLFTFGVSLTDTQLIELHSKSSLSPQTPSGLRTRRSELVTLGRIRDSGQKRKLKSGRMSIVWESA